MKKARSKTAKEESPPPESASTLPHNEASEGEATVQPPPLLQIKDLRIYFHTRGQWVYAVDGASLDIRQGEGLAVIGESGSGKTLSMMATLALVAGRPGVVAGEIHYNEPGAASIPLLSGIEAAYHLEEQQVEALPGAEGWQRLYQKRAQLLAGHRIGIIFQNPIASQDPLWSVGATLRESIRLREKKLSRKEIREEALEWMRRVYIKNPEEVLRSYPHQLSGGMCQRVMIASTLALRPRLIVADEPTTGLDMSSKAQVLALLREARERYGSTLVFITHEIGLVTDLVDRVVVMRSGKVVDRFPTQVLNAFGLGGSSGKDESQTHNFHPHTSELIRSTLELEERDARRQQQEKTKQEETGQEERERNETGQDEPRQNEPREPTENKEVPPASAEHKKKGASTE